MSLRDAHAVGMESATMDFTFAWGLMRGFAVVAYPEKMMEDRWVVC